MEVSVAIFDVGGEVLEDQGLLLALLAQGQIERLDAEVAGEGDRAIDVVAERLKELGCLRLDSIRLLLVAGVESEVHELLRIIIHTLPL